MIYKCFSLVRQKMNLLVYDSLSINLILGECFGGQTTVELLKITQIDDFRIDIYHL